MPETSACSTGADLNISGAYSRKYFLSIDYEFLCIDLVPWTGDEAYRKRQAMSGGGGGPAAAPAVMDMQVPFLVLQLVVQALTQSNSTDARYSDTSAVQLSWCP